MAHANDNWTNTGTVTFFPNWTTNIELIDYARGNESIIYFTDLGEPIETYIYARKKHPFASYPAAKHPNADIQQKPVEFFINTARASTLAFAIFFQI